jgi:hypothetical protein
MVVEKYDFGSIIIDGKLYENDIIIQKGKVEKRNKEKSKSFKSKYGHTPLTVLENLPWDADRLVVGTGMYGRLPITDDVINEAKEQKVELIIKTTQEAIKHINDANTNLLLHLTC